MCQYPTKAVQAPTTWRSFRGNGMTSRPPDHTTPPWNQYWLEIRHCRAQLPRGMVILYTCTHFSAFPFDVAITHALTRLSVSLCVHAHLAASSAGAPLVPAVSAIPARAGRPRRPRTRPPRPPPAVTHRPRPPPTLLPLRADALRSHTPSLPLLLPLPLASRPSPPWPPR